MKYFSVIALKNGEAAKLQMMEQVLFGLLEQESVNRRWHFLK